MAFVAAGIYVATSGGTATEPAQSMEPDVMTASIASSVERTMLTAHVVARSPMIAMGGSASMGTEADRVSPSGEDNGIAKTTGSVELVETASKPGAHDSVEPLLHSEAPTLSVQSARETGEPAGSHRDRTSPANVAAREIAVAESVKEVQRLLGSGGLVLAPEPEEPGSASSALTRPEAQSVSAESPTRPLVGVNQAFVTLNETELEQFISLGSDTIVRSQRQLLFVWDSSIILDEARSAELIAFAGQGGYDTLAVEASGVGYNDAALTDAFARFTADATEAQIETFALIGYPWFTVAANAGLPGQPTSSLEGIAILDVIAGTGLFDGVVDDSHPYGVVYEANGESRNRLFDDPVAAGLDFQAWLRSAKAAIGDLPLIKTTPFWYDSHPALQGLVNLKGEDFLTLGHLVASEVDAMAVLAYRDTLDGPNGILELVAGELTMGPSIITLEASDLGPDLDYLTFHEEGLLALESTSEKLIENLLGGWAFAGMGVHHYEPVAVLTAELVDAQPFGFIALDSANAAFDSLIDAYDSSIGAYTDQLRFASELNVMAGLGEGAILSNGELNFAFGALVHGDIGSGPDGTVTRVNGTRITGELITLSTALVAPAVVAADTTGAQRLDLQYRETRIINGDAAFGSVWMNSAARLEIIGPATISIDELGMNSDALILADTTHGPVTLLINDRLNLGSTSSIAPMNEKARDLNIHYGGTGTVIMGFRARILADIVAPNAAIELGSQAEIFGRAAAKSLTIRSSAKLHLDLDLQR